VSTVVVFATPDLEVLIGVFGQCSQGWLIELLEGFRSVARQPPERPAVQVIQQGPDALVQVGQREEGMVAQPHQDPAFNDLYAHFRLGFFFVMDSSP
jgi:hypothetical protein